jgi:hypothetical protein
MCPNCFVGLHWEHAKFGSPPCPKCGHEHPEGLTFEDFQRAKAKSNERVAAPSIDLASSSPDWQAVTTRSNRGALDDWTEYLCVRRRLGPAGGYEMAVCSFAPEIDEPRTPGAGEQVADASNELAPMTDDAVVELNDANAETILAGLRSLGWPDSGLEDAHRAIKVLR